MNVPALKNLTPREKDVFSVLTENTVTTREELLENAWGYPADIAAKMGGRTVDVTIGRIRKKIKGSPFTIDTVRGVGYRLEIG